ncbi:MAG: NAD-dependent succinate-semialdehyde dehydrogenase [Myxococcota bacterium]
MSTVQSTNPFDGSVVETYTVMTDGDIAKTIESSHRAFQSWRLSPWSERASLMRQAAKVLRDHSDEYARLMALEMGKPIKGGRAEVEKCAFVCDFYAENAETFLADEPVKTEATKSYTHYAPIGVVLAVMPWNFPLWQVFRFAAPALMAGNAGVLKHASNVFGSALVIEDVFRKAGFPEHLFRALLASSGQVAAVIENPRIRAVTLTGSTPAGRAVASKAGEMLKKTVLELGGSDPYVVLDDADLELAAETCAASRLINSGQSCIAAKRFIVTERNHAEFVERFVARISARKMGDPLDAATDVGPQARADLRDELHNQVERTLKAGAQVALGGHKPEGPGAFYPPTVLVGVERGMAAYHEELFGPVATVIQVKDEAEAIQVANDSVFGLGAAVFGRDVARAERIAAEELDAGCCFVNSFVKSDPRLAFGGVKESGYGRELGPFGIREFVNIKTVSVA